MSGNTDLREVHHEQKDIKRDLEKVQGSLKWIQLLVILTLAVNLILFVVILAR